MLGVLWKMDLSKYRNSYFKILTITDLKAQEKPNT
jgi:hypothetical protein